VCCKLIDQADIEEAIVSLIRNGALRLPCRNAIPNIPHGASRTEKSVLPGRNASMVNQMDAAKSSRIHP
jgi:hypothetical protein